MKTNTQNIKELLRARALIGEYKPLSKKDVERLQWCIDRVNNELKRVKAGERKHDGIFGEVFEVLNRPSTSRLIGVQAKSKADSRFNGGAVELKTQMGRIESLYHSKAVKYVVYKCYLEKQVNGEKCQVASKTIILTREQFLQGVEDYGTTSINGDNERFLRVNKKWFDFVNSCPAYDRNEKLD